MTQDWLKSDSQGPTPEWPEVTQQWLKNDSRMGSGVTFESILCRFGVSLPESLFRVFLNLWFAKPMVCMRVICHENDGNHENDENDSDSYKQGRSWVLQSLLSRFSGQKSLLGLLSSHFGGDSESYFLVAFELLWIFPGSGGSWLVSQDLNNKGGILGEC